MYVAPPMRMGAWSMARVLRQWIIDSLPIRQMIPTRTQVKSPFTYLNSVVKGTPFLSVIITGTSLNLGPIGVGCCTTTAWDL